MKRAGQTFSCPWLLIHLLFYKKKLTIGRNLMQALQHHYPNRVELKNKRTTSRKGGKDWILFKSNSFEKLNDILTLSWFL